MRPSFLKEIPESTAVANMLSKPESEELPRANVSPSRHKLKKSLLSKSMPGHEMFRLNAEDETITSLRSSHILTSEYPNPDSLPPPGKFPRPSSTPDRLLRSRSTDDIAIRRASLQSHMSHSLGQLLDSAATSHLPLQEDTCSGSGNTTSLSAIWESLTLTPLTDACQLPPANSAHAHFVAPSDIALAAAAPVQGGPQLLLPSDSSAQ